MKNKIIYIFILLFAKTIYANTIVIQQKPIIFNQQRIRLTQQYRSTHYGINTKSITIKPLMIVLHWTNYPDLSQSFAAFNSATLTDRPELIKQGALNVSAHFLVDRNGDIYQLMPSNWMARHVIGLDNIAIGIENVGGVNDHEDLTAAQVKANVALIRYLKKRYPSIIYLIGHFEYGQFRNTPLWLEKNPHYFTVKADPGAQFMKQVREQVRDLHLLYVIKN